MKFFLFGLITGYVTLGGILLWIAIARKVKQRPALQTTEERLAETHVALRAAVVASAKEREGMSPEKKAKTVGDILAARREREGS